MKLLLENSTRPYESVDSWIAKIRLCMAKIWISKSSHFYIHIYKSHPPITLRYVSWPTPLTFVLIPIPCPPYRVTLPPLTAALVIYAGIGGRRLTPPREAHLHLGSGGPTRRRRRWISDEVDDVLTQIPIKPRRRDPIPVARTCASPRRATLLLTSTSENACRRRCEPDNRWPFILRLRLGLETLILSEWKYK